MTTKTRNGIAIAGVILIASGIAYHYYVKNKGKPKGSSEEKPKEGVGSGTKITTPGQVAGTKTEPIKVATQKAQIVSANDVLASSETGANAKAIYGIKDGYPIMNLAGAKVGRTAKGKYLGVVTTSTKNPNGGYVLIFLGTGNVKYIVPGDAVGVKTN